MTAAGDLNRRVRLEKRIEIDDPAGGSIPTWKEQFTRAAQIKPLQGSRPATMEPVMAQRLQGVQPTLIIVRFDSLTRTIEPSWRAVEISDGVPVRYYSIKTADDMERKREFITMLTDWGSADGGDGAP